MIHNKLPICLYTGHKKSHLCYYCPTIRADFNWRIAVLCATQYFIHRTSYILFICLPKVLRTIVNEYVFYADKNIQPVIISSEMKRNEKKKKFSFFSNLDSYDMYKAMIKA